MSSPASTIGNSDTSGVSPRGPLAPGSHVRHYELIREWGVGGAGPIFLARDTRLGRRVLLQVHTREAPIAREALHQARDCTHWAHENIVRLHEVDECDQGPFRVWEYLPGQSLKEFIGGERVAAVRAVELMIPVLGALAHAHARGIIHGDLTPETVQVTETGTLKVFGFGLAPVLRDPGALALPHSEASRASLPYLSPEQWSRGGPLDPHADLWAVGIMLFQLISGRHPLSPLEGAQLAATARLDEPLPRLRTLAPDAPPELAALVDRCLSKHRDERFEDATALLRALEPFRPGHPRQPVPITEENPYTGTSSFQEADADRFFGRSREIAALVHRLQQRPLLAVVGAAGSGKSSLVRAGLVPALKRSGTDWEVLSLRPGAHPLTALVNMVVPLVSAPTAVEWNLQARRSLEKRLWAEPGYVGRILCTRARREKRGILLVVDPLEELYTQVPDLHERRAFTACLLAIADDVTSPLRVVLSVRSEFLERVAEDEPFMAELNPGLYFLTPPEREGLREALIQPAKRAGYQFESTALLVHMLRHLENTQGALPLLQFAATRLWEARDSRRKLLTVRAYQAMGGIAGALAKHADTVLSGLSPRERAQVRALLLRLVTPERTRAIVRASELRALSTEPVEIQRRIDHLVQAHLLVVRMNDGAMGATVELVHESLVHGWPTLQRWLAEDQEDALFLEQLRAATDQWQASHLDPERVWHGERVEEARRFQQRFRGALPPSQQEFLAAVFARAVRDARQERARLAGGVLCLGMLLAGAVALGVLHGAREEAEARATASRTAEAVARAAEATASEAAATARQRLAELQARKETAHTEVALANAALLDVNERLLSALLRNEQDRRHSSATRQRAERSEREARKPVDAHFDGPMTVLPALGENEP